MTSSLFELLFESGPRQGEVVPVEGSLVAGRNPDCSLSIRDPSVSRQHAKLLLENDVLTLVDNSSANGTFLNDQRIEKPVRLAPGDLVRLGQTGIRVRQRGAPPAGGAFGFHDTEAELAGSVVMSMVDLERSRSADASDRRFASLLKAMSLSKDIDDLDRVLDGLIEVMFDLFPQCERGFVMLGSNVETLQARAARVGKSGAKGETPKISTSICRKALAERAAFLFDDSNVGADFASGMSIATLQIRSAMTIPLLVDNEILGLLQVDTPDRSRAFKAKDLELAAAVSGVASIALRNAQQLARIETETRTRDNLCRFLPGPVAQQVLDGKLDLGLGGRTYQGTVLFSDVVGFTRISESLAPEAVIEMMNAYFDRVVPCIKRERGAIDKFIGDAIMAFWGVPIGSGNSAADGCSAALAMQIALLGFNSHAADFDRPVLGHGIGLNTGPVVAGNIGSSSDTISYTLLGDTVNTASRIEHHAMAGQVLVSRVTWEALGAGKAFGLRMHPVRVRNKAETLALYSLRGLANAGGEVLLYLPIDSGGVRCWLVRRLADETFVALHPAEHRFGGQPLTSAAPEWPGVGLGRPAIIATLPAQSDDGALVRTQVRFDDPSLSGLLARGAIDCPLDWGSLTR
jgi:adenylate cyclase